MISDNWKKLIKPSVVKTDVIVENRQAVMTVEPLEKSFGITLGNSLRRILLSSLQGLAITGIKIEGVFHEFSSIDGVKEDVTDIILNLKSLEISGSISGSANLKIKSNDIGVITGADIECPNGIEILNKDVVVCNINKKIPFDMTMMVESNKGYIAKSDTSDSSNNLGFIKLDAIFSPVKKVSYKVENTRVGENVDYDKLYVDVTTNGTIDPENAIAYAAKIMQNQLDSLINFQEEEQQTVVEEEPKVNPALFKKVDELEFSVRSANCLRNDNIIYIGDLVQRSEIEMLRTPNFGRKSLNEIKEVLKKMNLHLGMKLDDWPPENMEETAKKYEDKY